MSTLLFLALTHLYPRKIILLEVSACLVYLRVNPIRSCVSLIFPLPPFSRYLNMKLYRRASVVGSAIRDTRETIHDTTVTVCGRYRELYQRPSHGFDTTWGGMADDDPFQALIDDGGLSSRFQCSPDSLFASHSPSRGSRSSNDTNGSLSLSTSGRALNSLGSFGQTEEARDRGPFFSRCQGSSLSPLSSASSATHFGAPDEMSASDVAAAARDQKVPEEDLFWTASSVCKVRTGRGGTELSTCFCSIDGNTLAQIIVC